MIIDLEHMLLHDHEQYLIGNLVNSIRNQQV